MIKKKKPLFLRLGYTQYSKLGLRRKKKLKYRKAKGGENKVRLKMKGHLRNVSIGFKSQKEKRGLFNGLKPIFVKNLNQLKKLQKDEIAILAKFGNKKKKEILDFAIKNKIKIYNVNPKKIIEKIEKEMNIRKEDRAMKKTRIIESSKRAKVAEKKKEEEKKDKENLEDNIKNYENDAKENIEEKK